MKSATRGRRERAHIATPRGEEEDKGRTRERKGRKAFL
jgi:hypothetical protein